MVASSETGRAWRVRRRERDSWVRFGRRGVCGPVVERMRERVWRKRARRWGVANGL